MIWIYQTQYYLTKNTARISLSTEIAGARQAAQTTMLKQWLILWDLRHGGKLCQSRNFTVSQITKKTCSSTGLGALMAAWALHCTN
jgi:hypothetical protein